MLIRLCRSLYITARCGTFKTISYSVMDQHHDHVEPMGINYTALILALNVVIEDTNDNIHAQWIYMQILNVIAVAEVLVIRLYYNILSFDSEHLSIYQRRPVDGRPSRVKYLFAEKSTPPQIIILPTSIGTIHRYTWYTTTVLLRTHIIAHNHTQIIIIIWPFRWLAGLNSCS